MRRQDAGVCIPTSTDMTTAVEKLADESGNTWVPGDWVGKTVWELIQDWGYATHTVVTTYQGLEAGTVTPPTPATYDEIREHNEETS
jgi:hypothetical protein